MRITHVTVTYDVLPLKRLSITSGLVSSGGPGPPVVSPSFSGIPNQDELHELSGQVVLNCRIILLLMSRVDLTSVFSKSTFFGSDLF